MDDSSVSRVSGRVRKRSTKLADFDQDTGQSEEAGGGSGRAKRSRAAEQGVPDTLAAVPISDDDMARIPVIAGDLQVKERSL